MSQDVYNEVIFGGNPSERPLRIEQLDEKTKTLWNQKPDDWGNSVRPANLNRGVYKGGRRPIDIFWRVAKGINGAQMPRIIPRRSMSKRFGMWSISCWPYPMSQNCSKTPARTQQQRQWPLAADQ